MTKILANRLHHTAYVTKDLEATRAFYEDVLGLPLAHVIRAEIVPSTGEFCPYVHLFFKMADNSYIAFFDLGAFSEGHPVDLAGDPRAHFDGFRGFEAAGELVPFGDRLLDHLGHAYLRRGGRLHGVGGSTASADHHHCQGSEGEAQGFE